MKDVSAAPSTELVALLWNRAKMAEQTTRTTQRRDPTNVLRNNSGGWRAGD